MAEWWKERVVYQIYPRSYQDTNGDGLGDIPGIIMHLDELRDLGIGILWLSPVYKSPDADNGYDISDYRDIHPGYGTMEDMDRLIEEAGKRDIKVVMDLVINHTSNEHEWFQKSRQKIDPYTDYYIWRPAKEDGSLPNNWGSFFAEDCWEFDEVRGEYYLHLFAKRQPDLNYYNQKVIDEVKDIMRFWLDKGVSGFRCDVINIIYKSSLEDGKKRIALTGMEHYLSQEGTHRILQELRRDVLDHYDCFTVGETVFVDTKMGHDLCDPERKELNMIFSFEHMDADCYGIKWFKHKFSLKKFAHAIAKWQIALDWNANYLENHDQLRAVSRYGDEGEYRERSAKMIATMLLSLRGTPYIYQGQEIGMTNFDFTSIDQLDCVESKNVDAMLKGVKVPSKLRWKMIKRSSRDNVRTPVQWDDSENAGFTTGTPWLGINSNFKTINMAAQMHDGESIRSYYKQMIQFRAASEVMKFGKFRMVKATNHVFVFERVLGEERLLVLLNFSRKNCEASYLGEVVMSNTGRQVYNGVLKPYEALILK